MLDQDLNTIIQNNKDKSEEAYPNPRKRNHEEYQANFRGGYQQRGMPRGSFRGRGNFRGRGGYKRQRLPDEGEGANEGETPEGEGNDEEEEEAGDGKEVKVVGNYKGRNYNPNYKKEMQYYQSVGGYYNPYD